MLREVRRGASSRWLRSDPRGNTMFRKMACAAAILVLSWSVGLCDELTGVISKVEADKIVFKKGKDTTTYDLDKDVKVYRMIAKGKKELDPDGLKAEPLPNLPKGGALAVINVVDGKVTEISLPTKKKKA
jgi:hypothetical protein